MTDLSVQGAIKIPNREKKVFIEAYEWGTDDKSVFETEVEDYEDVEQLVADYFNSKGFLTFNVEPENAKHLNRHFEMLPPVIKSSINEHPEVDGRIVKGFPDLIVYKPDEDEVFYVEVKSMTDSLLKHQMDFFLKSDRVCYVAWVVDEEVNVNYDYKCPRCKSVFDDDKSFSKHECEMDESDLGGDDIKWGVHGYGHPDK